MKKTVSILFSAGITGGKLSVSGKNAEIECVSVNGKPADALQLPSCDTEARITADISCDSLDPGPYGTLVRVCSDAASFSFFLRDVNASYPIYIPEYGVAVVPAEDTRDYAKIAADIVARGGKSKLQKMAQQPQESFENAAAHTRVMKCPTWLGLSRDIRLFEIGFRAEDMSHTFSAFQQEQIVWDWIKPRYHMFGVPLDQLGGKESQYAYMLGRGIGCVQGVKRKLYDDCLPILQAAVDDEDVAYDVTYFVSPETRPISAESVKGTPYQVADARSFANVQTPEQQAQVDILTEKEKEFWAKESCVLFMKITARNLTDTPKYGWVRLPVPSPGTQPENAPHKPEYDAENGFGYYSDGQVYMTATLNGKPCPSLESAVLILPGETAEYIVAMPHTPISYDRAKVLEQVDYNERFDACVRFWKDKLSDCAKLSLPEKRIEQMYRAGILHMDLIAYGTEPDGVIAPVVGVYSPIGSESAPIIQFFDSIGRHDFAERELRFFYEKQHDNGFMQNFCNYMLETGAVLWTTWEHWKYTGNTALLRELCPKIKKACEYIISEIDPKTGLQSGQVADPADNFSSFMLNGYAAIGLKCAVEMLDAIGCGDKAIADAAVKLRKDLRESFAQNLSESPVMPNGDGTWCPSSAPWTEYAGPLCLYAGGGSCMTHGGINMRDAHLGPMWMFIQQVIDPNEQMGDFLLRYSTEHYLQRNTGFSQPYYCVHPYAHLKRGEVNAYLEEFYSCVSALADRETYSFWEHFFHDSPHKTHEEAWFLMRLRWMLYFEDGNTLRLLSAVPDKWFESGEDIAFSGCKSRFGTIDLSLTTEPGAIRIRLSLKQSHDIPDAVTVRIPKSVAGAHATASVGTYDPAAQTLTLDGFTGETEVILHL